MGMKRELTAFVWLCGPVAGLVVQPLIGYYSDRSSSTYFGKRKPFLFAGLLLVTVALLMIGVIAPDSTDRNVALWFAVAGFYILDFAINVLMSSARSFLVDSLEGHQQVLGNAFAGRMLNAGDLCGYFIGGLDLGAMVSVKGEFAQIRLLCILGIVILWASGLITLLFTTEEPHHSYVNLPSATTDSLAPFRAIIKAIWSLNPKIQKLCETQFYNWLGWFPFLFYSSTWLIASSQSHGLQESSRIGSKGLFLFSLFSLLTSLVLPYIQHRFNLPLSKLWALSLFFSFLVIQMTIFYQDSIAMILLTVSLMGIPWFATGWAPFALISLELTKRAQEDMMAEDDDDAAQIPDSSHSYTSLESALANSRENSESGLVLGIHNMYICIPQLLSSLVTSFVFFIFDGNGPEALGWVIRVGSLFTCIAAFKAWHIS